MASVSDPMLTMVLIILHRWLGVVVGAIMTLWCLSGFVMLYADYPRLLPAEQPGASRKPAWDASRRIAPYFPATRLRTTNWLPPRFWL
ncbi:hypothetical protein LWE61_06340 [Sphingobium sufflavum]|nr:hypothetical protein [Sphingobium sufflavum]